MRNEITGTFLETHGLSDTYEYGIWGNMLYRCRTATSQQYPGYGARGIYVCEEWHSFDNFIADMGVRPSNKHSLDRIDPNGPYSKDNCRWASPKMQARNRRNSVKVTVNGETMQVDDFCDRFGVDAGLVKNRLRRGWSIDRILATPARGIKIANN